jgi:hypothetical protein
MPVKEERADSFGRRSGCRASKKKDFRQEFIDIIDRAKTHPGEGE